MDLGEGGWKDIFFVFLTPEILSKLDYNPIVKLLQIFKQDAPSLLLLQLFEQKAILHYLIPIFTVLTMSIL